MIGVEGPSLRDLLSACSPAPCDPDLFFGLAAEFETARQRREAKAKAVCARCPVRAEVPGVSNDTGEADGIPGGASEDERRAMRRQRRAS